MDKKVLIADDDIGITEALKLMLEDEGYQVEITLSGAEIRQLDQPLPALLVLDVWMAGEDGREICKYLKNQERTRSMPIILFSASQNVEQIAQEVGADDFLLKPFDLDDLLNKVEHFVCL